MTQCIFSYKNSEMFSSSLPQVNSNILKTHLGVDLSHFNCYKLEKSNLYSKYQKDELHYVIDAVQKGLKPHTRIGLKRLKKKNQKKANIRKVAQTKKIQKLNPESPESLCLKSLRSQFRQKIEKQINTTKQFNTLSNIASKQKSQKIVKRKLNQRKRRNELIHLVKKYKQYLIKPFGNRLNGYGRCPKVSRKQIKDYLKSIGIQPTIKLTIKQDAKKKDIQPCGISAPRIVKRPVDQDQWEKRIQIRNLSIQMNHSMKLKPQYIPNNKEFPSLLDLNKAKKN